MTSTLIPKDFERAITLGLSRAPNAGVDEAQALALLSLVAQRKRHLRRGARLVEADDRARHLHDDPRPTVPDVARKPLLRLATSLPKDAWHYLGPAIFEQLSAHKVRLHPFDFPRLEPLLQACPEYLGQAERTWLELRATPGGSEAAHTAALNETDWLLLPKAQKATYIRQLRASDVATARAWIERSLASSPADVRTALILALEVGLSAGDAALLEHVTNDDRATSVREAAMTLLAATRGSAAYVARLDGAIALIEKSRTLLGRRTLKANAGALEQLLKGLPANTSTGARAAALDQALQRAFQHLYFSDIAKGLGFSAEELAKAIPADDALSGPLTIAAIVEGDADILGKMTAHLARFELSDLINHFGATLARLSKDARSALLAVATQRAKLNWRSAHDLFWLGRLAGGPVSDALARKLLAGTPWSATGAYWDASALAVFASLMPRDRDADFAAAISDIPRKDTAAAYEYFAFKTALQETPV